MNVLVSKENDCRSCYKCIRSCPVKSISFHDGQARIVQGDCVLCGRCYLVCPQNCKEVRDDRAKAKALLRSGKAVCSLAPSFHAAYPGSSLKDMEEALLSLGFHRVEETALGATLVKRRYEEILHEGKADVLISTCCPSVNALVEKYYPELVPFLAPVMTPLQAHAKAIKSRERDAKVIFIGPCIAKKEEGDMSEGLVDSVLTFQELDLLLEEAGISLRKTSQGGDRKEEGKCRLFPVEGGILDTMGKEEGYRYLAVGGMDETLSALEDIKEGRVHHAFVEMSSCHGSCVNGPIIRKRNGSLLAGTILVRDSAGPRDFPVEPMEKGALSAFFHGAPRPRKEHSEEEIRRVLSSIGKRSPRDELNCSSCGYPTCRAKAIAVLEGKASEEMCLPYLMAKAENFGDTIVEGSEEAILVLDESFHVELANPEMARLVGAPSPQDLKGKEINALMDPALFALTLGGEKVKDRKIYLAEYGKCLMATITYEERFHVLIGVFRDITKEEERRSEALERARRTAETVNEVVERNMRAVQEIASLLGESAAETKVALTRLKEALPGEDEDGVDGR